MKLLTPFGTMYLLQPDQVVAIGPAYKNRKYPEPSRQLILANGKSLYVLDTPENIRPLVGEDYSEDKSAPIKKQTRKRKTTGTE